MHNHLRSSRLAFLLCLAFLLQSCYEPTNGCLDILSDNYNVAAEDECDDCCTYPNVEISISHRWKDNSFSFSDTLANSELDSFVLLSSKLYLSNFSYLQEDDSNIRIRDSSEIRINSRDTTIASDIIIVRKNQIRNTNHTYRAIGQVSQYNFTLGVSDDLNTLTEVNAEKIKALEYNNGMRISNGYASCAFEFIIGEEFNDTISIFIQQDFTFSVDTVISIQNGSNLSLPLTIDYDLWFKDVDFMTGDLEEITTKITDNTTNAFH